MVNEHISFDTFFNEQLNPAQQEAVKHHEGPLLVVAGAGSGKTRVITARIAQLILKQQVSPTAIVALTFTNKAAAEMKERITRFLDTKSLVPFIGTFHSYCLQMLKTHAHLLKHQQFTIMDADDQQKLLSSIVKRFNLGKKVTTKQLAYHISKIKNSLLYDLSDKDTKHTLEPMVQQVYRAYEHEKSVSKCFDFDDLLIEMLRLFQTNPQFKEEFHQRIRHILVDEYQDTNVTQHELLKHMTLTAKKKFAIDSLCVVGDEDQSIYSWRGATVANIMNFKKDFPHATTITVDQNYRSAQPILEIANNVIQHNVNRNPKKLWSDKKGKDRIRALACLSGYQEADAVASLLQLLVKNNSLKETAILYRAHYQSRTLEESLIKHSIPYRIIGGIQFYERAEIKDLLAYIRLIINPFDRISFFRIINTPTRGLGEKFEEEVYEVWGTEPFLNFKDVAEKLLAQGTLTKVKKDSLTDFIGTFDTLTSMSKPTATVEQIIKFTGYLTYLKDAHDPEEAQSKIDNVKELVQAIKHFEEQGKATLSSFLDEVTLMQEKNNKKTADQDHVQLMTLHAAKGLEFNNVILTGLEEGVLPSGHAIQEAETLEEERRLLYVGITRARERLLMTHARYRHTYGQMEHQLPSRFLSEIPDKLVSIEDCSHWHGTQIQSYFGQWLNLKAPASSVMTFGSIPKQTPSTPPTLIKTKKAPSSWKKFQPVQHPTFGIGVIQDIEQKGADTIHITARFSTGVKKVDAKFLKTV